jgi:hypothetical protein
MNFASQAIIHDAPSEPPNFPPKEAPLTHDLLQIALQLPRPWTEEEKRLLADLTEYAVAARYDDPLWAEREATPENVAPRLARVETLLASLLP